MALIDTLKLAHALRDKGGFSQEAAEGVAEALNEAFAEGAATKGDIAKLGADLRGEISELGGRISVIDANLGGRISAIDAKLGVVMWAVGVLVPLNIALTLGVLWRVLTLPGGPH